MNHAVWRLGGITVAGACADDLLWRCWQTVFADLPAATAADIRLTARSGVVPQPPPDADLLLVAHRQRFLRHRDDLLLHLPGAALLTMRPATGHSDLLLAPAFRAHEPLLEDLLAVALSPHLRRRRRFLLHAFGGVVDGAGVLLVGDSGAGKTTSGLALLQAGWGLLGNDVVMFDAQGTLFGYPGRIAAHADSVARFTGLAGRAAAGSDGKLRLAPEDVWPGCRRPTATPARLLFPRLVSRPDCALRPLTPAEALGRLLPHTLDRWDGEGLLPHLAAAEALVGRVDAHELLLGGEIGDLPRLLRPA